MGNVLVGILTRTSSQSTHHERISSENMEPRFYSTKLSLCSPWHAWNHSLARVTDATWTFWFLIIQFPKQYSSSSKHLLLFISLFFLDSCWAHWMTLTLQPNPKSKHFTFYIFFFPKTIQSSYYPSHNRFHFRDFLNLFFFFTHHK